LHVSYIFIRFILAKYKTLRVQGQGLLLQVPEALTRQPVNQCEKRLIKEKEQRECNTQKAGNRE